MKSIRLFLVALAAFFSLSNSFAQIQWEYGFTDKQTQEQKWPYVTVQEACDEYVESFIRWRTVAFPDMTGNSAVDVYVVPELSCNFKIKYFSGGVQYTSGNTAVNMLKREAFCDVGTSRSIDRWGCYIAATDSTPLISECSGLTPEGSHLSYQVTDTDNCRYNLDEITSLIQEGAPANGWQGYKFHWMATGIGEYAPPLTADPVPDAPTSAPPEPDPNPDPDPEPDPDPDADPDYSFTCSSPPDFYTPKYPAGLTGVFNDLKAAFNSSTLMVGLTHLVPNFQTSACPSFSIPLPNMGNVPINIPCEVWTFIKAVMLITATLFSVRLIFGGA